MKTIKIFAIFAIAFGFALTVSAQDNASILGKALVLQSIDVANVTDLDFGWVSPGLAKTIDLENVATGGQVGEGTETTGVFTVSAAAGSNVQLQFTTLPEYLVADGPVNLPIGTYTAGYHTEEAFDGVATFAPAIGTQVSSGNFPTNPIGSVNGIYVFIGATVTPATSQAPGAYQAAITLTATYN